MITRRRERVLALFREFAITFTLATDVLLRQRVGQAHDGILKK
jgi:hypothetical protein